MVLKRFIILLGAVLTVALLAYVSRARVQSAASAIDLPTTDSVQTVPIRVLGWAVDPSAGENNGPGIEAVRITEGTSCDDRVLIETPLTERRTDVVNAIGLDPSYEISGFDVLVSPVQAGQINLTLCGISAQSGETLLLQSRRVFVLRRFAQLGTSLLLFGSAVVIAVGIWLLPEQM